MKVLSSRFVLFISINETSTFNNGSMIFTISMYCIVDVTTHRVAVVNLQYTMSLGFRPDCVCC